MVRMLGYHGSIPGPTLKVQQGSEVVHVTNEGNLDTTGTRPYALTSTRHGKQGRSTTHILPAEYGRPVNTQLTGAQHRRTVRGLPDPYLEAAARSHGWVSDWSLLRAGVVWVRV